MTPEEIMKHIKEAVEELRKELNQRLDAKSQELDAWKKEYENFNICGKLRRGAPIKSMHNKRVCTN